MKKMAKLFQVGETFKRFGYWRVIEKIFDENLKVTFQYTQSESDEKVKGWATFKNKTLVPYK